LSFTVIVNEFIPKILFARGSGQPNGPSTMCWCAEATLRIPTVRLGLPVGIQSLAAFRRISIWPRSPRCLLGDSKSGRCISTELRLCTAELAISRSRSEGAMRLFSSLRNASSELWPLKVSP